MKMNKKLMIPMFSFLLAIYPFACSSDSTSSDSGQLDMEEQANDFGQESGNDDLEIGLDASDGSPDLALTEQTQQEENMVLADELQSQEQETDPTDEDALVQYSQCVSADDAETCEAASGKWAEIPGGPGGEFACFCDTNQEDQTCNNAEQCWSACIAEPNNGVMDCEGVTEGKCAATNIFAGCHCFFDDQGEVSGMCIN